MIPAEISIILSAVIIGGLVKGFNGFGYAIIGTTLLTIYFKPSEAVSIMIIPLIAAEFDLATEMSLREFSNCLRNFFPFLVLGMAGTVIGVFMIDLVPQSWLKLSLGVLTLAFVASKLEFTEEHFDRAVSTCFEKGSFFQTVIGFLSGIIFGSSNIAVQVVSYLESLELDEETFIGMLAIIMIGFSTVRLLLSIYLGYFDDGNFIPVSAGVALFGVAAVSLGERAREHVNDRVTSQIALIMLTAIALKLIHSGILLL